jgi:transposase
MEAPRCLKRRLSDVIYRQLVRDAHAAARAIAEADPGGHCGATKNPARPTYPRTSTLPVSHFPDPQPRRYARDQSP